MSFDKSMLSLFSREALDACEKMRIAARSGDGELAVGAARALRSAAKMLGFDSCAALAEKLEKSLSENFEKSSSSPSTIKALEVISECAKVPPENIPSAYAGICGVAACSASSWARGVWYRSRIASSRVPSI